MYLAVLGVGILLVRNGVLAGLPVLDEHGAVIERPAPDMLRLVAGAALGVIGVIGAGAALAEAWGDARRRIRSARSPSS